MRCPAGDNEKYGQNLNLKKAAAKDDDLCPNG